MLSTPPANVRPWLAFCAQTGPKSLRPRAEADPDLKRKAVEVGNVCYVVTSKGILVFYRRREAVQEAQDMAKNLSRVMGRSALIMRVKSRPYYRAGQGDIVPALAN